MFYGLPCEGILQVQPDKAIKPYVILDDQSNRSLARSSFFKLFNINMNHILTIWERVPAKQKHLTGELKNLWLSHSIKRSQFPSHSLSAMIYLTMSPKLLWAWQYFIVSPLVFSPSLCPQCAPVGLCLCTCVVSWRGHGPHSQGSQFCSPHTPAHSLLICLPSTHQPAVYQSGLPFSHHQILVSTLEVVMLHANSMPNLFLIFFPFY